MKMSSRRACLEGGSVAQHCPHHVDPPAGERAQGLRVPLALGSLAVVEGSGLLRTTQAGKRRLVEDAFEGLVPSSHPATVTHLLARVTGRRDQTRVGGEMIGTFEGGADVGHTDHELGPEDRPHAWQTNY